jgi:hypothetical protein
MTGSVLVSAITANINVQEIINNVGVFNPITLASSGAFTHNTLFPVTVPVGTKTITLQYTPQGSPSGGVFIYGSTSGIVYYQQPPYLGLGGLYSIIIVPINSAMDTVLDISINTGTSGTYNLWADTDNFTENHYYNGPISAAASTGVSGITLIAGPCRLLTAAVAATTAFTSIQLGTINICSVASTGGAMGMSFPGKGIIIPYGQSIKVNGTGQADITYAYP